MSKPDGGAAFPKCEIHPAEVMAREPMCGAGMTLRDWFAGQALGGFLSGPMTPAAREILRQELSPEEEALGTWQAIMAARAYGYADAMLHERSKG